MSYLDPDEISIVHWFNETEQHRCGYCKNENGSISNGMWAETLTIQDYQNLIDRGWRRSGKYCYKPIMDQTCCPQYTIRCSALKFTASKSQKKVIKKFNKFCMDGLMKKEEGLRCEDEEKGFEMNYREGPAVVTDLSKVVAGGGEVGDKVGVAVMNHVGGDSVFNSQPASARPVEAKSPAKAEANYKKGEGADPSRPPCKKAKLLRLERKQQKLLKQGMSTEKIDIESQAKTLKQFLDIPDNAKHKLTTRLVPTSRPGREWEETRQVEYELYRKYQMAVHNDPPDRCTEHGFTRFLVNSPLKITTESMHRKHRLFKSSAQLFAKFQMTVFNEPQSECDENQFFDFLVDSPLKPKEGDGISYGSFHQQYWLDGKLIAVGVIDILPKCVSSVYFFYDPDCRSLSLGTYGSLREIQLTRDLHEKDALIEYYYMGYYIHSCPKMRYKGKLSMSDLLCPETYTWVPIEKCIPKLEVSKYSRLNDDLDAVDDAFCTFKDVDEIKVLVGYKFMDFGLYKKRKGGQKMFENIGTLIGKKCAKSLLFVISN